jgi:hypothetical protein
VIVDRPHAKRLIALLYIIAIVVAYVALRHIKIRNAPVSICAFQQAASRNDHKVCRLCQTTFPANSFCRNFDAAFDTSTITRDQGHTGVVINCTGSRRSKAKARQNASAKRPALVNKSLDCADNRVACYRVNRCENQMQIDYPPMTT